MIAEPLPSPVTGYESLGLLGRGGSGAVYKALQVSTGQVVALKFPHADPRQDGRIACQLRHRLHHEMRLCATLHHPHIVRLVDQGLAQDGQPFCAFEYVPGDTLSEHLRRHGALPITEATALMERLLDALVWLHARRITHRDLKPQNVMVFSSGASLHPKVLDFGIAACLHDPGACGAGSGTPAYCAPEQLRGQPPAPQADLYAWALLFLECLQGRPVLDGMS
ncbi:MAG TPA: serine/threonine-protein kinase, partial [Burkholderiaceae bacterium]|nr:serine/threonine-protein kinase [Burkholderiaceae bacterium]